MAKKPKNTRDPAAAPHAGQAAFPTARAVVEIPDVRAIRKQLYLSQAQFAILFGFSLSAVRAWEQDKRRPELPLRYYLYLIEQYPDTIIDILRGRKPGKPK